MILTTHALVGAAVGKYVPNILMQIFILIPLHYAMDVFRHGEYFNKKSTFKNATWKVTLDLLTCLTVILLSIYWLGTNNATAISIFSGAFISMFPDLLTVLYWKYNFKLLGKIYHFHQFVHCRFPNDSPQRAWTLRNAVNDILFSVIAITLLFLNFK